MIPKIIQRPRFWWVRPLFAATMTVTGFALIVASAGWVTATGVLLFAWGYRLEQRFYE